jgi:hypothetical protein
MLTWVALSTSQERVLAVPDWTVSGEARKTRI